MQNKWKTDIRIITVFKEGSKSTSHQQEESKENAVKGGVVYSPENNAWSQVQI